MDILAITIDPINLDGVQGDTNDKAPTWLFNSGASHHLIPDASHIQ